MSLQQQPNKALQPTAYSFVPCVSLVPRFTSGFRRRVSLVVVEEFLTLGNDKSLAVAPTEQFRLERAFEP